MTVIDRQKYVAELGKLLSGMARADREAVLRGVNARFDEAGDDNAVIAALGSPTFAAVSVLRGYTPPEDAGAEEYEEDYESAGPEPEPEEPEAGPDVAAAEEPEAEHEPETEAVPGAEPEVEPEPEAETEPAPEPEAESEPETEAEPEPAAGTGPEPEPEAASGPETEAGREPAQEAEPEPEPEAGAEAEPAPAAGPLYETVFIGSESIEVYSDGSSAPAEPEPAPEAEPVPEPEAEAEPEAAPEPAAEQEAGAAPEQEAEPEAAPEAEAPAPEPVYAEPEPERPPRRGGRVFLCVLLFIIAGIPAALVLTAIALAAFAAGASLGFAGVMAISFAFLGMGVASDIMLCVGSGLFTAALGLGLIMFAVWFFIRCVSGLYGGLFARSDAWCRGEVRK